jgi:beta-lactamase superfamily II metal-dependent hydrolase
MNRRTKWLLTASIVLVLFAIGIWINSSTSPTSEAAPAAYTGEQLVKVHFIDVGQADSIYIQLPDHNDILIDGGNVADGSIVIDYLVAQGVDDIELMIATHPHEDHIGGLPAVLDAFVVERIIDSGKEYTSSIYRAFLEKALAEGAVYEPDNRQTLTFGNVALQVITGNEIWSDINDYSVVCRLDTGEIEFMFMGDAETPVESAIQGDITAEILKVGHHGSSSSSGQDFLARVSPDIAIISVGDGNSYGHPTAATLSRLQSAGAMVYRTDLNGHIVVATDGQTYSVNVSRTY